MKPRAVCGHGLSGDWPWPGYDQLGCSSACRETGSIRAAPDRTPAWARPTTRAPGAGRISGRRDEGSGRTVGRAEGCHRTFHPNWLNGRRVILAPGSRMIPCAKSAPLWPVPPDTEADRRSRGHERGLEPGVEGRIFRAQETDQQAIVRPRKLPAAAVNQPRSDIQKDGPVRRIDRQLALRLEHELIEVVFARREPEASRAIDGDVATRADRQRRVASGGTSDPSSNARTRSSTRISTGIGVFG